MRRDRKIIFRLVLLFSVLSLLGAAEFPPFEMEELDFKARQFDKDLFKDELRDEYEVPRISKRYDGTVETSLLPVDKIVIKGVIPYPERNITQEIIQGLIDEQLTRQKDEELDDNGFTKRDLDDVGGFLRTLWDRGSVPDAEDARLLIEMMQLQDARRGWITIEQIDSVALAVTEHYRENGFILATAFIPEQDVAPDPVTNLNVIELSVLEGRLGEVSVSNNEIFSAATISSAFNDEIGQPVTEEQVESALRRINDLPGVRVRGSFSPGDNVGETRLNLNVLDETSWTSSILGDNHGSETTGENRIFATTQWLNIAGKGHRFVLGLLRSEGPDSTTYGLAEYEIPVTKDRRGKVKAQISSNTFSVTRLANLPEIIGETDNYNITGSYQFIRGRTRSFGAQAGYTQKDVLFKVGELTTLSLEQVLETFSVAADYTQLWDDRQLIFTGRIGVDQGHIIDGAIRDQSVDFTKILVTANLLKRFSINNWLTKKKSYFNFVAKLNSQYTEKFLSSVEQFSLGGPTAVRAFGVSDVSVDSGIYTGFELFFDFPFNPVAKLNLPLDPLKPYVFYDYAYGVTRALGSGSDRDAIIKGYGFGMRISWPGIGVANLILAKPQSASYQDNFLDAQGKTRIYLDVTYQIH